MIDLDFWLRDYKATKDGKVWSNKSNKYLLLQDANGYKKVFLYRDGQSKSCLVHRLVAHCHLVKVPGKDYVNHKNGVKSDNMVSNLEYVTPKENALHSFSDLGRSGKGANHKLTSDAVIYIRNNTWGLSQRELAVCFDVSQTIINKVIRRRTYKNV